MDKFEISENLEHLNSIDNEKKLAFEKDIERIFSAKNKEKIRWIRRKQEINEEKMASAYTESVVDSQHYSASPKKFKRALLREKNNFTRQRSKNKIIKDFFKPVDYVTGPRGGSFSP